MILPHSGLGEPTPHPPIGLIQWGTSSPLPDLSNPPCIAPYPYILPVTPSIQCPASLVLGLKPSEGTDGCSWKRLPEAWESQRIGSWTHTNSVRIPLSERPVYFTGSSSPPPSFRPLFIPHRYPRETPSPPTAVPRAQSPPEPPLFGVPHPLRKETHGGWNVCPMPKRQPDASRILPPYLQSALPSLTFIETIIIPMDRTLTDCNSSGGSFPPSTGLNSGRVVE